MYIGLTYGDLHSVAAVGGPRFDFDRLMDFPVGEARNSVRCNGVAIGWVDSRTLEQVRERTQQGITNPVTKMDRTYGADAAPGSAGPPGHPGRGRHAVRVPRFGRGENLTGQIISLGAGALL